MQKRCCRHINDFFLKKIMNSYHRAYGAMMDIFLNVDMIFY